VLVTLKWPVSSMRFTIWRQETGQWCLFHAFTQTQAILIHTQKHPPAVERYALLMPSACDEGLPALQCTPETRGEERGSVSTPVQACTEGLKVTIKSNIIY